MAVWKLYCVHHSRPSALSVDRTGDITNVTPRLKNNEDRAIIQAGVATVREGKSPRRAEFRVPLRQWGTMFKRLVLERHDYVNLDGLVRIAPCDEGCTFEDVMRQAGIDLLPVR